MINEGLESKQSRLGRVEPLSHLAKPTRREAGAHNSCLLAAEHRLQIASNNCSLKIKCFEPQVLLQLHIYAFDCLYQPILDFDCSC